MWFSKKTVAKHTVEADVGQAMFKTTRLAPAATPTGLKSQTTTKRRGDAAEALALNYLCQAGLKSIARNYRTPGRGGGEVDLVMQAPDGTLVFVEVRQRASASHGGAGASIGGTKQRRIVFAARHYLMQFNQPPPCRFDVVLVQGQPGAAGGVQIDWLVAAFDAS